MVFENNAHMFAELVRLNNLSFDQRIQFENKLGFLSLATIKQKINQSEINHQESFYKNVSPELSIDEYEQLGFIYEHSAIFNHYLEKQTIKKIIEKDRSWSFETSVNNPGFLNLLNEDGYFLVGSNKYQFVDSRLIITNSVGEVLSEINFLKGNSKMQSNWTQTTSWEYDGNSKRFDYNVYGSCITSSNNTVGGLIESSFYVNANGEEKKYGSWASRSSYRPVYSFTGSWSSSYTAQSCFTCKVVTNPFVLNDDDWSSPYSWTSTSDVNGPTNNFTRYFRPNGSWALPEPWLVVSALQVNYSMNFNFSGGSSGFARNLSL